MKVLILIFLFLFGCRSIPQDTTPAPIENNQMTLEMNACNQESVGLAGCFYESKSDDLLTIPLWDKGEYQIESERCDFKQNRRYENSQKLKLSFASLLKNKPESEVSCLYNIKVFIDGFDSGFKGLFLLAKKDIKLIQIQHRGKTYDGYVARQFKEESVPNKGFVLKAMKPGKLFWSGCNKNGSKAYRNDPVLTVNEFIEGGITLDKSCILTIGMIPKDAQLPVEYGKIHISVLKKTVVSLSAPSLSYEKKKLTVTAEKMVSGIIIGDEYKITKGDNVKVFSAEVKKDALVNVRIMTSNGRYLLMKVKNGEILWIE